MTKAPRPFACFVGACYRPFLAFVLAFALVGLGPLRAANYTITAASPDSVDLSNVGLLPGDTVFIQAHTRQKLILQNLTAGTAENPILITNLGGQFIIDTTTTDKGLHFYNCRHFILRGTPSPGNYDYGIKIARVSQAGAIGLAFIQGSTDFEVSHLEISNVGFAAIMAKSDNLKHGAFTMRNVSFHHLYIHDVGGEGIYVGSSFYHDTAKNPHEIHGVAIHHNRIENTGWDGIQLGCATQNAAIYRNRIVGYGGAEITAPDHSVQNEGIRVNPGTTARVFDNYIQGGNPGSGSGIFANPHDDSVYYNNVIVSPGESGIVIGADAALNAGTSISLLNNTIVSPAQHGIEFWSTGSSGNTATNNLIVKPGSGSEYIYKRYPSVVLPVTEPLHVATVAEAGFVNAAAHDYRLAAGSPAIDEGVSVASFGVTTDLRGVTRPFSPSTDIGAHEYVVSPTGVPLVVGQSTAQSARLGSGVTLEVIATGNEPLTYAWTRNGTPVPNATAATLTLSNLTLADAGDYVATVTNALGSVASTPISLTVIAPPPVIATHPANKTAMIGSNVTFTIALSPHSVSPFTYQWKKGGVAIPGATAPTLSLTNVQTADAGDYTVTVTNPGGSATSSVATLTLTAQPALSTAMAITTLASDATVRPHVNTANTYTHAINLNASSTVTVNGVPFGFGTGNGGGAQPAKNYTLSAFSHAFTTFNSTATGSMHTLLATHGTNTSSATYTLTLTGLTAGKRYTLALFTNSTHGTGRNWYRVSQNLDTITTDVDFSAAGANTSRMLTIGYSATGPSVTFTFTRLDGTGTTGSSSWVGFAGFTNHEVRQTVQRTTSAGHFDFNYLLTLPPGYDPMAATEWPLLVFLHGIGERSNAEADPMNAAHLDKIRTLGPPLRIEQGDTFPFVVVAPQCSAAWWDGAQLEAFIEDLKTRYRIDRTRVYLTGLSMGGFGVYDLAQRQPSRYAAIAPISAAPQVDAANSAAAPKLRDLPIRAYHGANDPLYPVSALQSYLDLIRNAGGNPGVTIYNTSPGNAHDAWVPAYADDSLYTWLLSHSAPSASIATPPQPVATTEGDPATFTVTAAGRWPFTYQWTKDGVAIAGATSTTLTLEKTLPSDSGDYAVTVTNGVGSATSVVVPLTITPLEPFQSWIQSSGLPENQRGAADNPDADNQPNLLEFVFGTNPALSDSSGGPVANTGEFESETYPVITYTRRRELGGVVVEVVVTTDLNVENALGSVEVSAIPRDAETDTVIVRSTQSTASQPRQFFHLLARLP
jgi:poly(3-hydroxybutyrate) depolymerase